MSRFSGAYRVDPPLKNVDFRVRPGAVAGHGPGAHPVDDGVGMGADVVVRPEIECVAVRPSRRSRWSRLPVPSIEDSEVFMSSADIVRASFDAYLAQERDTADRLIAEDFVFTSPQDDHIDKAAFFERCFPTADRFISQKILELVSAGPDKVFILYEYELKTGDRHRNTEFIRVRDGQLVETQVFFGGRVR
jgi:ketosteroid isomerase-like protein